MRRVEANAPYHSRCGSPLQLQLHHLNFISLCLRQLKLLYDDRAHLLRQFLAANGLEMHVSGFDEELRWEGRGEGVQVIDGDCSAWP